MWFGVCAACGDEQVRRWYRPDAEPWGYRVCGALMRHDGPFTGWGSCTGTVVPMMDDGSLMAAYALGGDDAALAIVRERGSRR